MPQKGIVNLALTLNITISTPYMYDTYDELAAVVMTL